MNLIFFDIDGTLAIHGKVPESAETAVRQLREKGDLVFICTGRWRSYAEHYFGRLVDGFICSNGRLAFQGEKILYDEPLTAGQIEELTKRLSDARADYMLFGEKCAVYGGNPERFEEHAGNFEQGTVKRTLDPTDKIYNFDVYFENDQHREEIQKTLGAMCVLNPHGKHPSADVTIVGVDKGVAMKRVAACFHVPMENTYAFGDGTNDICMMEAAGHGIAMGNAQDEVKEKAEYVTTDILKDGVKNGLEHYGLLPV